VKYIEHLMHRAETHWENDEVLPATLFAEMLSAGIDVAEAENNFQASHERLEE
jgi:hypothetical protein